jgi:hypothetical protein
MQTEAFKERVKRLQEVNEVVEKLDPAVRAAAFTLLTDYVTGTTTKKPAAVAPETHPDTHTTDDDDDGADFFAKHPSGKPAENALTIAAFFYSQYGASPFQLDDIRSTANAVGLTIPDALDMTLKQASRDGKALFQHTGRNQYKPSVNGELYFQKKYEVTKGKKQRPAASSGS